MKKRVEKVELENKVKTVYRIYFWEFMALVTLCHAAFNWLYFDKYDNLLAIVFLLCLGFSDILDGKDEIIKFTRVKEKIK